jgi:hypothetical protein
MMTPLAVSISHNLPLLFSAVRGDSLRSFHFLTSKDARNRRNAAKGLFSGKRPALLTILQACTAIFILLFHDVMLMMANCEPRDQIEDRLTSIVLKTGKQKMPQRAVAFRVGEHERERLRKREAQDGRRSL